MVALLESDASLPAPLDPIARLRARLQDCADGELIALELLILMGGLNLPKIGAVAVALAGMVPCARLAPLALVVRDRLVQAMERGDPLDHDCPHGSDCPGPECASRPV
jgi:hypothetical protein